MRWFRFYSTALDDPKVQRLPGDLFKGWVNLLCLANEGEPRGTLPSLDDIAFRLRLSEDDAAALLHELTHRGLLDAGAETLQPHNWADRQFESDDVTRRVRKHRAAHPQPVTGNVSSTVHDTQGPETADPQPRPTPSHQDAATGGPHHRHTANIQRTYAANDCNVSGNVTPALPETPPDTDTDTEADQTWPTATQPAAAERDNPARVVARSQEVDQTKSTPYDLYTVLCEELEAAPEAPPPPRQMGIAKRLAKRYTPDDVRGCLRYLTSQHWRNSPIDLATVEAQIEGWILNGRPEFEPPPRQRPGAGMTPIQIAEYARALERQERAEQQR